MKIQKIPAALLLITLSISQPVFAVPVELQNTTAVQPALSPGETSAQPQAEAIPQDFMMASPLSAAAPAEPRVLGVENGGTVSGVVEIRPDLQILPPIKKVAWYLDGNKSGKVYQSPFMWGGVNGDGTQGFDTRTIADGDYTLSMVYTDGTGDHEIIVTFTVNNTATPPDPDPTGDPNDTIWGINDNDHVSGIVKISPNTKYGATSATWTLEGQNPVTVNQNPYFFGGASGNGTQGFDTRTVPDGVYSLTMALSTSAGSVVDAVVFVVDNTQPDPLPAATPVTASGRTLGGLTFPSGTSFVDVDQAGNLSFVANRGALYTVNTASNQLLSAVNFNPDSPILDILAKPDGTGVFVLERGQFVNDAYRGRLWFANTTNPANPVFEFKSSTRDGSRLAFRGTSMVTFYPSSGENLEVACPASGSGAFTTNFSDIFIAPDFVHFHQSRYVSTSAGLSFITLNHNDVTTTQTAAPVAFFSPKDNYLFVSLKNGTTAVYDINGADTSQTGNGIIPVVKTIDPQGNDPIFNLMIGNHLAVLDSTGLVEIFDVTDPLNPTLVDSGTIPGARRLDSDGTKLYAVTDREYIVFGAANQPPAGDSKFLGVEEGQTVSGIVNIRPNPDKVPGVKKVAYYLDGAKSGKVYQSPYIWGGVNGDGTAGFDTRTLADGNYTLSMVYTDATGDHEIVIHFTVDN